MTSRTKSVVSLFSGAGGLDAGLEQAGFKVVSATDFAPHAMQTLRDTQARQIAVKGQSSVHLAGTKLIQADVQDLRAEHLRPSRARRDWRPEILVGGPPCQPWSSAGKQLGLQDPRGKLIAHFLRLIDELNPRFVIFENVRGLVTARGENGMPGEVLRSIQDDLFALGYSSRVGTLNAADYGAAQRRVRLILVASKGYRLPLLPTPTRSRHALDGLPAWISLGKFLGALPSPRLSEITRPSGDRAEMLRALAPGTGIKTGGKVMANRPSGQWGYRQDAFLADLSLPSRTIRAASTPDWIRVPGDDDLRRLTWRECAALQGFPLEWKFSGTLSQRFQQIGNAVQVDMAEAVGRSVMSTLRDETPDEIPVVHPWPENLQERVRYTVSEHLVNGHLRVRGRINAAAQSEMVG